MLTIDRRSLLRLGTFGLGALAVPGAAQMIAARGFTHNVASGEPGADSVMLWTRYVPSGGAARLDWQVAETADFARIAAGGSVTAEADHDYCVKPVAGGLAPGRWYFFRFVDRSGRHSPVGRTRTLPEGPTARFKLAVFSCSNLPFGWFNAYAHAAERDDIDLMVHLGDYLYEYGRGTYPSAADALAGRVIAPVGEIVHLADYRLRHAAYRVDPDLQRLHQLFPMVMMWDDHELANNPWTGGAQNHQPETEGDWEVRKAAALRACHEWLPISDSNWESYEIGDLATLFRPETRISGRVRELDPGAALAGREDRAAALAEFLRGPLRDPARTLLGPAQERWLHDGFGRSVRAGKTWQVLAQQAIMGALRVPPGLEALLSPQDNEDFRRNILNRIVDSEAGMPMNLDQWDGYPAARERLLRAALDADANLVVLSGDSHNAWAFDLDLDGAAAGVEFAAQSVTSPGYETYVRNAAPVDVARVTVAANPQLKWAEMSRRGYLTVELTPERVAGEWLFLDTVRERSTAIAARHAMGASHGTNRLG